MFNKESLADRLKDILEALQRIPRRFETISSPDDFLRDEAGREHLDSICMILIAAGEAVRQLDTLTKGEFLPRYPEVPWGDVIGIRNVLAHGYFDVDAEQLFDICTSDIPLLIKTVGTMLKELQGE